MRNVQVTLASLDSPTLLIVLQKLDDYFQIP